MTVQECIQYVESHLEIRLATNNGAYTCGRTINPVGCVNHSVGCAQPAVNVFYNSMNKSSAGWGVNALLGDFHQGEGRILLTLNWNSRPWGVGSGKKGSWNNTKIQWEICEPAGHTYAGGTMIGYDVAKTRATLIECGRWLWRGMSMWLRNLVIQFLKLATTLNHIVLAMVQITAMLGTGGRSTERAWTPCVKKYKLF